MEIPIKKNQSGEFVLVLTDELAGKLEQLMQMPATLKDFSTEIVQLKDSEDKSAILEKEIAKLKDPGYLRDVIQQWADGLTEEEYKKLGEYRGFAVAAEASGNTQELEDAGPAEEKTPSVIVKVGETIYPLIEQ
jgi:hypothetical protein